MENKTEEKKYYDTTANEITRIIEYINTSGILKEEKQIFKKAGKENVCRLCKN